MRIIRKTGSPLVGKSRMIYKVAKKLGMQRLVIDHPFVLDPVYFKGLPKEPKGE